MTVKPDAMDGEIKTKNIDDLTKKQLKNFNDKIDKGYRCWIWTAYKTEKGYGQFNLNGESILSHRISYKIHNGSPKGNMVLHKCDNPNCVNPNHLYLGDNSKNIKDAHESGLITETGEQNNRSKITESEAKEIIKMKGKEYAKDLAKKYPVSKNQIYKIWSGERWGHLSRPEGE
jgi:hypothetical protein